MKIYKYEANTYGIIWCSVKDHLILWSDGMEGQSKKLLRGECNEAAGVGLMVVELYRMRPRAGIARESQNFCFQLDIAKKKKEESDSMPRF